MRKILTKIQLSLLLVVASCAAPTAQSIPSTEPYPAGPIQSNHKQSLPTNTPEPTLTSTPSPPSDTPEPSPISTLSLPSMEEIESEQIETSSEDRILRGTLIKRGDVAVILAPMFDRTRNSWMTFAHTIAMSGFTVLAFDYPGFGASSGEFRWSNVNTDTAAVIDYLHQRGYKQIVCIGASLGAFGCLGAALLDPSLKGLVIISDGLTTVSDNEAAVLLMPKLYIVADEPDDIKIPMEETFQKLPEPKQFEKLEVKSHGTNLFRSEKGEEFQDLLLDFLENLP
ncbi:MAG: alpha/beta fold hydrolase [Chloroflexota bacterium]|nr:MAG: alpha/beta fold hydrolase [Chloroflexota bacterium]